MSGAVYVVDDAGCWVWQRGLRGSGYGYGSLYDNGRMHQAHRVFYERTHGPIPEGLELDHICRNTRCVNPDHLEPVTHTENMRRGRSTKLTHHDAASIKAALATGEMQKVIAARFGVSESAISLIRHGRRWADVSGRAA